MTLGQLPVAALLQEPESGMVFRVAAREHPGYGGVTLVADRIVRKGCFDAAEPRSDHRWVKCFGSSDYGRSNIHQWLNAEGENWFSPLGETDAPPGAEGTKTGVEYYTAPGFLSRFSPGFREALLMSAVPCAAGCGEAQRPDTVKARVFLLSADEIGLDRFTGIQEGTLMPLFRDFRMRLGIKEADVKDFNFPAKSVNETNRDMGWYYWLRTPHHREPYISAHVHVSGYISYMRCYNSDLGIRPAMNVDAALAVSAGPDENGVYTLLPEGGNGK